MRERKRKRYISPAVVVNKEEKDGESTRMTYY